MTILQRIVEHKRAEVEAAKRIVSFGELRSRVRNLPATRGLAASLRAQGSSFRVIAEIKRASPSKGLIRGDFDAVSIAVSYERAGAAGISVLTDSEFFRGSLDDLRAVRRAVELPLLRKDFMIDEYQVWEARAAGADAILLIVAALDDHALGGLSACAEELGLDVLWEVHDEEELERARKFEPALLGINNRDLRTFEVRLETTRDLIPLIPEGTVVVSESGFVRREELARMREWGSHAFLIGESLMRAEDPGAALAELLGSTPP